MKATPDNITELQPNQVFVFGSNIQGIHGKGAALTARKWGAVVGQGVGLMGRTYAIPTRTRIPHPTLTLFETLPLPTISRHILDFVQFAVANFELEFLVTPIGCGLADLEPEDLARFFRGAPPNVALPRSFILALERGAA